MQFIVNLEEAIWLVILGMWAIRITIAVVSWFIEILFRKDK